ncbi:hypothetical protein CANTEDRAFT_132231 [Yamadazyma tenuis ATCC 10573]|uniref:Transcriptional coactivator HFI1/ADA1 n=1 Tax=Candida tenuis (strain ATCC 10573 / BCRC 21748 / CBS 615 / JCM 9827 / NBRC 10315 / NRRL Y-1498 / VKM Y-70) TaxID=590646 RepID=G3BE83_CANTC|nr:uncharacterized protein CANTEDRAFT_132231 [Yamadazyma tenuis ATCC 10573]EGV60482.1 hypothetical protein CANTEDRAFT_132231 [Yamadazyma tenuis ATCC 10573]
MSTTSTTNASGISKKSNNGALAATSGAGKRNHLEQLIRELQNKLGPNWDKYHENLSLFLIGKLSRQELVNNIVPILKNGLIKYHNQLLLLNFANSFKNIPIDFQNEFASFWNKKSKNKSVKSSQYEKFKQNIMGLPIKERRRIRAITREAGKKNKINAGITLTRHALLPKIPSIQDKEQQQLQVNNLVGWQQDVLNGINTPISTDTYELPDNDDLSKRIIMVMREAGLTGGINPQVLEVMMLGLESYLKNIVESTIDVARYRANKYNNSDFISTAIQTVNESINDRKDSSKANEDERDPKRRKVTLNIHDMFDSLEMFPYLIEPTGTQTRLNSVMLKNDDEYEGIDYELPPKIEEEQPKLNGTAKEPPFIDKKLKDDSKNSITEIDISREKPSDSAIVSQSSSTPTKPKVQSHIGSIDELKWVLHDLYSQM